MSKVLTEYEVVRFAAILETMLQNKYGTCPVLFQAYKEKKEEKPILMVMYDAMVYEETYGLASLDDWYYAHPECHAQIEQYLNTVHRLLGETVPNKDFPLVFSYKLLQNHLPEKNPIVKQSRFMYDRLQRLSNKIRFPKGSKSDREFDRMLAKDGFATWDDYLAYVLERQMGKSD